MASATIPLRRTRSYTRQINDENNLTQNPTNGTSTTTSRVPSRKHVINKTIASKKSGVKASVKKENGKNIGGLKATGKPTMGGKSKDIVTSTIIAERPALTEINGRNAETLRSTTSSSIIDTKQRPIKALPIAKRPVPVRRSTRTRSSQNVIEEEEEGEIEDGGDGDGKVGREIDGVAHKTKTNRKVSMKVVVDVKKEDGQEKGKVDVKNRLKRDLLMASEGRVKVEEGEGRDEPSSKRMKVNVPDVKEPHLGEEEEEAGGFFEKEMQARGQGQGSQTEERTKMMNKLELEEAKDEGEWIDLDAAEADDPTMVVEYVKEIFGYMMDIEHETMPNPSYMLDQPSLAWEMRGVLMDWLIEVHHKFRLLPETLFLTTNIIDRFLSARIVSLPKLQLVGLTCLFIAAKYEEIVCPSIHNFLHMADGVYEDEEILQAERYILATLGFDLSYPNPIHFLRRTSKADNYDISTRTVAKYFMEIACLDHGLLSVPPSLLGAAGIYLARICLDRGEWDPTLTHFSSYTEKEIFPAAQLMLNYILKEEPPHECFHKKYASKKYMKASTFVRAWAKETWPGEEGSVQLEKLYMKGRA